MNKRGFLYDLLLSCNCPFRGEQVFPWNLAGNLSPLLGGFLDGQLGLLLLLLFFDLLLFLLTGLVFILLAAFFSHQVSPF